MAVYPRHKALVDQFVGRYTILRLGLVAMDRLG
jgi:hypothetical protein